MNQLNHEIRVALEHKTFDVEETIRKSPPEAFIHKTEAPELPFSADSAQFRGEQNRTRVTIGVAVNLGLSQFVTDSTGNPVTAVGYGYVLNDRHGVRIGSGEQKKEVLATASGKASVLGSVSLMEVNCAHGQYVMAVQAVESNGARKGMAKLPLLVRDFRGTDLMLSDLQFCVPVPGVANEATGDLEPKTVFYPFNIVLKSIPLMVYFESYNLSAIGLNNEYRIDYNITEAPSPKNLFSALTKPFRKNDDVSITLSELRTVT